LDVIFSKPYVSQSDVKFILKALSSSHLQGDGPYSKLAENLISKYTGGGQVLSTPSCTHALEMTSLLLDILPGDEVIMPSFTFTSSALAVSNFGAIPVFVDSDPTSGCIDVDLIKKAISRKTKAISWVNYAGNVPDISQLREIATNYNLQLIEDNAHGFGGEYAERALGSFGDFSTSSFHSTKNFQCGEGGALVVNNLSYFERAQIIREKGTNRKQFMSGDIQKYEWIEKGSSYLLAEVLSALLYAQILDYQNIQESRLSVWHRYFSELESTLGQINMRVLKPNSKNVAHMFAVVAPTEAIRGDFINEMALLGTQVNAHYQPLHLSPAGRKFGKAVGGFSGTLELATRLFRLPIWSQPEQGYSKKVVHDSILTSNSIMKQQ